MKLSEVARYPILVEVSAIMTVQRLLRHMTRTDVAATYQDVSTTACCSYYHDFGEHLVITLIICDVLKTPEALKADQVQSARGTKCMAYRRTKNRCRAAVRPMNLPDHEGGYCGELQS